METSNEVDKLMTALSKVQAQMRGAKKDAVNPHFKNRYADLASVWEAWRDAGGPEVGLIITQSTRPDHEGVHLVTTLFHSSGQWIRSELHMPVTKKDPQGYGSALSYARRYAFAALVGIVADDDDGNAASSAGNGNGKTSTPSKEVDPRMAEALRAAFRAAKTAEDVEKTAAEVGKLGLAKGHPVREEFAALLVAARSRVGVAA